MRKQICIKIVNVILYPILFYIQKLTQIERFSEQRMCDIDNVPNDISYCLILGARLFKDDSITPILKERLDIALRLKQVNPNMIFILSGDGRKETSNDVRAMKKYLNNHADAPISQQQLLIDNLGINTYASMKNLKHAFRVDRAIILTSTFHMPRSLYVASQFGIDVWGIKANPYNPRLQSGYKLRERLALVKSWSIFTFRGVFSN